MVVIPVKDDAVMVMVVVVKDSEVDNEGKMMCGGGDDDDIDVSFKGGDFCKHYLLFITFLSMNLIWVYMIYLSFLFRS